MAIRVGTHEEDQRSPRRFRGIPGTSTVMHPNFSAEPPTDAQSYLSEMINEKKLSSDENKDRDLLSNLVRANEEFLEDGEQGLSDDELFGMGAELVYRPFV